MEIHVVRAGETLQAIAELYNISVSMLIRDNGLEEPYHLVTGQALVIAVPELTYTVREGDNLADIALSHKVSVLQLLQNNPFLSSREYIYPGEELVISYPKKGSITTHGNTLPFVNLETLRKTLPYLTYLSVLNYTATSEGEIATYYDDSEIIQTAKAYGVMPLMFLTTLTIQGEANIRIAYDLLLNEDFQNRQIENILTILREKGYYGVTISFEYINVSNLQAYESYYMKLADRLNEEGYPVFALINPNITLIGGEVRFELADYSLIDRISTDIIFMNYEWAKNTNPPSPISSIHNMDLYLNNLMNYILPDKIIAGLATIGYDWELPFSAGISSVNSLTLDRAIDLAWNRGAVIQFDELSQTPFFIYSVNNNGASVEHIVWFIDARSIDALLGLVSKYGLNGVGIWNIALYNTQLWLIINSQYEIRKII